MSPFVSTDQLLSLKIRRDFFRGISISSITLKYLFSHPCHVASFHAHSFVFICAGFESDQVEVIAVCVGSALQTYIKIIIQKVSFQ